MCKRILVVDDDKPSALIISKVIKAYFDVEVDHAESVNEAVRFLMSLEYACVITDISLPLVSGHVLVKYCVDREIPVIAVTAFTENIKFISDNARAVIMKPINFDQLKDCVSSVCKIQDHAWRNSSRDMAVHD